MSQKVEVLDPVRSTGSYWPKQCPDCGGDLSDTLGRLRLSFIELTGRANQNRALHEAAQKREARLQEQLAAARAKIRSLQQQLFGKSTEQGNPSEKTNEGQERGRSRRKRGQQPGNPPPPRRQHPTLPVKDELIERQADELLCPICGKPPQSFIRDDVTEIKEIRVEAYIRRITRRCYTPGCQCGGLPQVMTPAVVGALFAGSQLGVSIWVEILLAKYRYGEPIHRLLDRWDDLDLSLAAGTIHGNIPRLGGLIAPVAGLIAERNRQAEHWHIDETGWLVFAEVPGKVGHRWWLWVFVTEDTVVFKMSPSRSAEVVRNHLGESPRGIASVDRYSAYKAVSLQALLFLLAFCWAHVRRDFLKCQREWPELQDWCAGWLERIAGLYHANNLRREAPDASRAFQAADGEVKRRAEEIRTALRGELDRPDLQPAAAKILKSMDRHWPGLELFVTRPWLPMDNNTAERALRPEVVGRKNFWGSGSVASARLQADLGTVFFTLERNGINPRTWLHEYLSACALSGGQPPEDLGRYVPWSAPDDCLRRWQPPPINSVAS